MSSEISLLSKTDGTVAIVILSATLVGSVAYLAADILATKRTEQKMQAIIEHYKAPIHGVVAADANTLCNTHGGLLRLQRLDKPRMWDVQCGDSAVFHDVELVKDKVSTDDVISLKEVING